MQHIEPDVLDLMIARAKSSGEIIWYQIKNLSFVVDQSVPNEQAMSRAYDRFASMCDALAQEFEDKEVGELLSLVVFLRAGKRMPADIKVTNQTRVEALKEKILRRK